MSRNQGRTNYEAYLAKQMADPEFRREYERESRKMEVWLALVESHSLSTLRRYVEALGDGYSAEIAIRTPGERVAV
jgi:hypothetical protein